MDNEVKNGLQIFVNEEFGKIRTMTIDGEPWFVGKDVAFALCYNEPHKAVVRHVQQEDRTKHPILSDGGNQESWIINESDPTQNIRSGLYILRNLFEKYDDPAKVLMAYNMGETGAKCLWNKGIYETNYSLAVMANAEVFKNFIDERVKENDYQMQE